MGGVTPVWVDYDGRHVLINSARGRVVEITEAGADAHIDKLAHKYLGVDRYPFGAPGKVRVIYRIEPTRTTQMRR